MSARRRKRRKPQRLRVNVHKPTELLAWANYWGCTQQNVRDAVKISGVMVEDVEDWVEINVVEFITLATEAGPRSRASRGQCAP